LTFSLCLRAPLRSPLFPYTTLFRSKQAASTSRRRIERQVRLWPIRFWRTRGDSTRASIFCQRSSRAAITLPGLGSSCQVSTSERSEEHTSELQSRENLVCRLLLEKK